MPHTSGHRLLAPRRIGVCGSSRDLSRKARRFCEVIGRRLAAEPCAVIVSGGAKKRSRNPGTPDGYSADWHIVRAVEETLLESSTAAAVHARIETVLVSESDPEETFRIGTITAPRGNTNEARRFAFVRGLDAIVAVAGSYGTQQELSLALELGLNVLPVPCFEGSAARIWKQYEHELVEKFRLDDATLARWTEEPSRDDLEALADEMVDALIDSMRQKCFVIMPYDRRHTALYEQVIVPGLSAAGAADIRLDYAKLPGSVTEHIRLGITNCDYAIAVLDDLSLNVMYELGLAHALGKTTVLLNHIDAFRDERRGVPFDIRTDQRLEYEVVDATLTASLTGVLEGLRRMGR